MGKVTKPSIINLYVVEVIRDNWQRIYIVKAPKISDANDIAEYMYKEDLHQYKDNYLVHSRAYLPPDDSEENIWVVSAGRVVKNIGENETSL